MITIYTYDREWSGAEFLGRGFDHLTGECVLIVSHADFKFPLRFYAAPNEEARHPNIGSHAFWIAVQFCPNCSTIVDQADLFCGQCGTKLGGNTAH
jgi:hypothetical protein